MSLSFLQPALHLLDLLGMDELSLSNVVLLFNHLLLQANNLAFELVLLSSRLLQTLLQHINFFLLLGLLILYDQVALILQHLQLLFVVLFVFLQSLFEALFVLVKHLPHLLNLLVVGLLQVV